MVRPLNQFAVIATLLGIIVSNAHAGGPAFSGIFASADSAETVYNNPAGMSRLNGTQMTGQAIFVASLAEFEVDEQRTTVEGGDPREPDPAVIPAFYYQQGFREDWRLGISVNIPTGFGTNNGPNWAGRYYSDEFTYFLIAVSPAIAYRVNDHLSLGAGVSATYTSTESSTRINNDPFQAGAPDGKLEAEADGVGVGFSLSALYELSENTRVGLAFRSESDADLSTKLDFTNAIRPPGVIQELESQKIDVASTVPMVLGAGIFHRMQNNWEFTWDVMWMQFSEFGATEITISDTDIDAPDDLYEDFFATTVGISWPISSQMRGSVGILYVEQPIKNEKRSFAIALDECGGWEPALTLNWKAVTNWK